MICSFRLVYTIYLLRQNQNTSFVIDQYNETIIKQLFLYLTHDSSFEGDLHKGIMSQGKFGCGKTAIMETYSLIHNHIVQRFGIRMPNISFVKSIQLQEQIVKQTITPFAYRPLIIDEFGRESKTVQDFGNILRPISELLSIRSDNSSLTHSTTNFTLETLSSDNFYGGMIGDRYENVVQFHTDSRRKQTEIAVKNQMVDYTCLLSVFSVASLCFGMPKTTCFPLPMVAERNHPVGLMLNFKV